MTDYASVYTYNPANNLPGAFVDDFDDDDCYVEDFSSYDSYFALSKTNDYEPRGFQSGTWESPILPTRWVNAFNSHDDEEFDDSWGEFHSFPLSSEDKQAFETACQEGLSLIPVSFSCTTAMTIKCCDLLECPCFLLSLQPEPGEEAYNRLLGFHMQCSHDCDTCKWCTNCPTMHPDYFCICSGFTFTGPASGGCIPWPAFLPPEFNPAIKTSSINLLPPEEGALPPSRMSITVTFEKLAPDKAICQLSPRLLNVMCHRFCQSPYDSYKRRSSMSCFRDDCLKDTWYRQSPHTHALSSSILPQDTAFKICVLNTILLTVVLYVVLLSPSKTTELVIHCPQNSQ